MYRISLIVGWVLGTIAFGLGTPLKAQAGEPAAAPATPNNWERLNEKQTGFRHAPGLVFSVRLKSFVLFGGGRHGGSEKSVQTYDIMRFDSTRNLWLNDFPKGAESYGGETGDIQDPGFNNAYYMFGDKKGVPRPHKNQTVFWNQYALAPWDDCVYAVTCGRTLKYDPGAKAWSEIKADPSPVVPDQSYNGPLTLGWGALCADPVNQEILLFGGHQETPRGDAGTWVFSTATNTWRKLDLKTEPPPRAYSPLAFDPATKKIVLFGGTHLDFLYADTWVYDCATRTWEERKPALSPCPRHGHGLVTLPKSGKVVLLGGNTMTSTTAYCAALNEPLPMDMWSYDVAANAWTRLTCSGEPGRHGEQTLVCAAGPEDEVFILSPQRGTGAGKWEETWHCTVDPVRTDAAGTKKDGVPPGTQVFRTGPWDPEWYTQDVPPADPKAMEAFYTGIPKNDWTDMPAPKWPTNRQGGGWSTVAFDTDHDQLVHFGGGHSSYYGNDGAHYDLKTGRWTIGHRPMDALDYNYHIGAIGRYAFNNGMWGSHNYRAYLYDPARQRVLFVTYGLMQTYDPVKHAWPLEEKFEPAGPDGSKYTTMLQLTKEGVYTWCMKKDQKPAVFHLDGNTWTEIAVSGDPLPTPYADRTALGYDSKRHRLLLFNSNNKPAADPCGQVWSVDLAAKKVTKLNPPGWQEFPKDGMARDTAADPDADLMIVGCLIQRDGKVVTPVFDLEKNTWCTAEFGHGESFNNGKVGRSVDLGLTYDAKRKLIYAVNCNLRPGALKALRLDKATLVFKPFEEKK